MRCDERYIGVYMDPVVANALDALARKNNISVSSFVRAIVIDALVDEGVDLSATRRIGSQRYSQSTKRGQVRHRTPSRHNPKPDVNQSRTSVDA